MEAGLRTNTTACTLSIAVKISRIHSVVGGMASQSTQLSRPAAARDSCSLRTNSLSLRAYEMKISCIAAKHPIRIRRRAHRALGGFDHTPSPPSHSGSKPLTIPSPNSPESVNRLPTGSWRSGRKQHSVTPHFSHADFGGNFAAPGPRRVISIPFQLSHDFRLARIGFREAILATCPVLPWD